MSGLLSNDLTGEMYGEQVARVRYDRETAIMAACISGAESACGVSSASSIHPSPVAVLDVANRARAMYREIMSQSFGDAR